jgi:hypothetical protein
MKKTEIFQKSHGVHSEKFRKDLGSDPQNSTQILTNFGKKPMIFRNFACFGEIISVFQKPHRTNPENSGNTDGPIRNVPDRVWWKLKTLRTAQPLKASANYTMSQHPTRSGAIFVGFLKNMNLFVIFPKFSEVNPERFPKDLGGDPGYSRRKRCEVSSFSGNDVLEPKMASFPNQKHTNPEFSGNFLGSIPNAPEMKRPKIASLPTRSWSVWTSKPELRGRIT